MGGPVPDLVNFVVRKINMGTRTNKLVEELEQFLGEEYAAPMVENLIRLMIYEREYLRICGVELDMQQKMQVVN